MLVPLSQSGALLQVTQGQILTAGREHAAHRCTAFPFILHGHPGGMEKHHFRWDRSLNFCSTAELHASACIRISDMEAVSFFSARSREGQILPPQARLPAPCQPRAALSPLITTCLQCHDHLSPYPASSNELPSQVCQSYHASSLLNLHFIRHPNPPVNCTLTENNGRGKSQKNNSRPGNTGSASFLPQLLPRHLETLPVKKQSLPKARSFPSACKTPTSLVTPNE